MAGTTHVYPSDVEFLCEEVITLHLDKHKHLGPITRWRIVKGILHIEFDYQYEHSIPTRKNLLYWYKRIMKKITTLTEGSKA